MHQNPHTQYAPNDAQSAYMVTHMTWWVDPGQHWQLAAHHQYPPPPPILQPLLLCCQTCRVTFSYDCNNNETMLCSRCRRFVYLDKFPSLAARSQKVTDVPKSAKPKKSWAHIGRRTQTPETKQPPCTGETGTTDDTHEPPISNSRPFRMPLFLRGPSLDS
jgi:hypothetical protein